MFFVKFSDTIYKFLFLCFVAGPNIPRSTLHKTSSREINLVVFSFTLLLQFCFIFLIRNEMFFLQLLGTKSLKWIKNWKRKCLNCRVQWDETLWYPQGNTVSTNVPTPQPSPNLVYRDCFFKEIIVLCCLLPVQLSPRPRSINFGDVTETNGPPRPRDPKTIDRSEILRPRN